MALELSKFSEPIKGILAEYSDRYLPLVHSENCETDRVELIRNRNARELFREARYPEEALSGLLLRLNCWEESHRLSQDLTSAEASYWHAIAHRMEPDGSNAKYWFRKVGQHAIFSQLHKAARSVLASEPVPTWRLRDRWDPLLFVDWCEEAYQAPGSAQEKAAVRIQRIEWDLLFDWCGNATQEHALP